jgi:hypothetical protein
MKIPLMAVLSCALLSLCRPASAKTYATMDKALGRAFPGDVMVEEKRLSLTEGDVKRIEALSGSRVETRLVTYYTASDSSGVAGYAVVGSRVIRTKKAVYLAVINPDLSVLRVEILAFHEPEDYMPSERWLRQFHGRRLSDGFRIKRDIHAISGATISSHALAAEIRGTLAVLEIMLRGQRDEVSR